MCTMTPHSAGEGIARRLPTSRGRGGSGYAVQLLITTILLTSQVLILCDLWLRKRPMRQTCCLWQHVPGALGDSYDPAGTFL